jgi:site-specific DNA-methyltransferase (adenine-specific)
MINLFNGDCLEVMKSIKDNSIDAIITDPPYGTTACKWDSVIDFDLMWKQLNRIIKPNGAIVLFGSEPFSSALRMSNIKNYKYDWIWDKRSSTNPMLAKIMPIKSHEVISVFGLNKINYYPQMVNKSKETLKRQNRKQNTNKIESEHYSHKRVLQNNKLGYAKSVQYFKKEVNNQHKKPVVHPTQKPLALMEYLIKTYTNENETVLDFTMGSGTTGVACKNLNRNFIGIEKNKNYFYLASKRIKEHQPQLRLI